MTTVTSTPGAAIPPQPGDTITVLCDNTEGVTVLAAVTVEKINPLGCGCWRISATRPGLATNSHVDMLTGCPWHCETTDTYLRLLRAAAAGTLIRPAHRWEPIHLDGVEGDVADAVHTLRDVNLLDVTPWFTEGQPIRITFAGEAILAQADTMAAPLEGACW